MIKENETIMTAIEKMKNKTTAIENETITVTSSWKLLGLNSLQQAPSSLFRSTLDLN